MRENRTSGSVRGSRQAFHVQKYSERSVETVYSTDYMYKFNGTGTDSEVDLLIPEIDYEDFSCFDGDEQREVIQCTSSDDALIASVNRNGRVDLSYMEEISGLTATRLISDLAGKAIFQDPAAFLERKRWTFNTDWLLAPQYLCGSIPEKLTMAFRMNERFPGCFQANVDALKKLMPPGLAMDEIHVSLGASWIPAEVYSAFIRELLRLPWDTEVVYQQELSRWMINAKQISYDSVLNKITYGTFDLSALQIIEQTMNAKTVKVYDYSYSSSRGDPERILNRDKTLAAQEKQRLILHKFEKWILTNPARRSKLQELYNDSFVGYCVTPYDGSFLSLPGLNPAIKLYDHQKNAVARILLSDGNLLLAHDVGTGKTYEMIVSAHELHRMGLSEKIMLVVPNSVLGATVEAHRQLYPEDDILTIFPKDFTPKKRQKVLERIRDERFVCIYIAYGSFDMLTMSKDYYVQKQQSELSGLRRAAANATTKREKHALEAEATRMSKKLSEFVVHGTQNPWLSFDDLGIDTLYVDEIQNYKNIPIESKADSIVGMHAGGSKKCKEMLEKCRNVRRLIFATGTPLTNSLSDLFALQTYLQPEELRFRGIDSFDMWINTFAQRETNFEIDVDASALRVMTRFSSFHNLTELMSLFSTVCDFHSGDADCAEKPGFHGYENVIVPKSRSQADYIRYLSERTERIRTKKVRRKDDKLLSVTTDGRKAALDIRLLSDDDIKEADIRWDSRDFTRTKVTACADKLKELYLRYPGTCQAVFSDLGTPRVGFNLYDELRSELLRRGIPDAEIAYVHEATTEAARAKLFAAINQGLVRVIIGSTEKLGVGVNVQERLVALHHLSVPWRPADMVQREGRILRQGNLCKEVFIFRYITDGSFDSYSWQLLENKQRFISSFLSGTDGNRSQEDISDTVLSYAEVKALAIGSPLIKKRVETANRLDRARMASRQRQKQLIDLRTIVERIPEQIKQAEQSCKHIHDDAECYQANKSVIPQNERLSFGEELIFALEENSLQTDERIFDSYQGFRVVLPANMLPEKPYVYLRASGVGYSVNMDDVKPLGATMRLDRLLQDLPRREDNLKTKIRELQTQCREAKSDLEQGNPYQKTIEDLTRKLNQIDRQIASAKEKRK